MSKYSGVGVIIENQDGEFLLHLRDGNTEVMPNQWCLVGGSLHENEGAIAGAIREVKEETDLLLIDPVVVKDFIFQNKQIALIAGKVNSQGLIPHVTEGVECRFFRPESVEEFVTTLEYTNPYLDEIKQYLNNRVI